MRTVTTKSIRIFLAVLAVSLLPALATAQQQMESHIGKLTGHADTGKQLYFRYCWGCHGFRGDGTGENAPFLNILPRNFVAATFKCRSTPTGTLPTDQDLYNTIERGVVNSNMPSWIVLTGQNRADLIAFIKTFSPRWMTEKPGEPLHIPPEPKVTVDSISAARPFSRNWSAGSATVKRAAATVPRLPRLPTITISPSGRLTSQPVHDSSAARPTRISTRSSIRGLTARPCLRLRMSSNPTKPGTWCITSAHCR